MARVTIGIDIELNYPKKDWDIALDIIKRKYQEKMIEELKGEFGDTFTKIKMGIMEG